MDGSAFFMFVQKMIGVGDIEVFQHKFIFDVEKYSKTRDEYLKIIYIYDHLHTNLWKTWKNGDRIILVSKAKMVAEHLYFILVMPPRR